MRRLSGIISAWMLVLQVSIIHAQANASQKTELTKIGITQWLSPNFKDHDLVGRLFSASGKETGLSDMLEAVRNTNTLLVGETHDNPDHHLIQASLVEHFSKSKNNAPHIVFEMVPETLQPILDAVKGKDNFDLEQLSLDLKWEERGWYRWEIYRPIFKAALQNNLALKAGNVDRKTIRKLAKEGLDTLTAAQRNRYALNKQLTETQQGSLFEELAQAHCNLLPETALPGMALVQRLRDGAMAATINAGGKTPSVLIAGSGHVRKDRGVPRLLKGQKTLVIGLIEVTANRQKPAQYELTNKSGEPLFDYVVFTPKFDITDHCKMMREKFAPKKEDKS